jgi:hypothetical protein
MKRKLPISHTLIIRTPSRESTYPIFGVDKLYSQGNVGFSDDVFMFNFGNAKPAAERNQTLRRRRAAWQEGLRKNWGSHYEYGEKRNWTWRKDELQHYKSVDGFGPAYGRLLDALYPDRIH